MPLPTLTSILHYVAKEARERYIELKPSAESDISLEVELRRTQQQLGDGDYENKPVPQVPQ